MTLPSLSMTSIPRMGSKLREAITFIPLSWAVDVKKETGMSVGPGKRHVFEGHASFSDGCALPINGWSPDTYEVSSLLGCGVGVRTAGLSVLDPDYNPAPGPDTLTGFPEKPRGL